MVAADKLAQCPPVSCLLALYVESKHTEARQVTVSGRGFSPRTRGFHSQEADCPTRPHKHLSRSRLRKSDSASGGDLALLVSNYHCKWNKIVVSKTSFIKRIYLGLITSNTREWVAASSQLRNWFETMWKQISKQNPFLLLIPALLITLWDSRSPLRLCFDMQVYQKLIDWLIFFLLGIALSWDPVKSYVVSAFLCQISRPNLASVISKVKFLARYRVLNNLSRFGDDYWLSLEGRKPCSGVARPSQPAWWGEAVQLSSPFLVCACDAGRGAGYCAASPGCPGRSCSTWSWTRTSWRTPASTLPTTWRPTGRPPTLPAAISPTPSSAGL